MGVGVFWEVKVFGKILCGVKVFGGGILWKVKVSGSGRFVGGECLWEWALCGK